MIKKLPSFNHNLSRQLLSGFAVSLIVVGVASLSIAYTSLRRDLEVQIAERAKGITQGLEFSSEGLIEAQELLLLERIVQNYATLPAVIEVSVVDPNGVLVAHSNAFATSQPNVPYADLHPTLAAHLERVSQSGMETNIRTVLAGKPV
ncbi:MAG: hypothetical protein VKJ46_14440, partial [Leptolyngbyaceae bacterium]|nr:hypothetical protein [Leptolyngbyaceae bacterium]